MYYKIINLLVHIKLPEHFTFVEAEQVRYTRQTSAIINNVDKKIIKCNIRPTSGRFRDCFFYRTMDLWNRLPSHTGGGGLSDKCTYMYAPPPPLLYKSIHGTFVF